MVYGIIAEYNPFHSGHKYLIDSVKNENDCIIAVMSGNYVQRGDFAITHKWNRAEEALKNGVDLVLELPTPFALKSAPGFAMGAVQILESTGVVDNLLFGAEDDDVDELVRVAMLLQDENINRMIKEETQKGISFPAARQNAVNSPLLKTPNNILAIEYIAAAKAIGSPIGIKAVKRIGSGHDSEADGRYPSASYIRKKMKSSDESSLMSRCENAVLSHLRRMTPADFAKIEDVNEGLEYRIYDCVRKAANLEDVYRGIKSKRYTLSRIRRIILRAYLDIYKDDFPRVPYIKVLAFNRKGIEIMQQMKKEATLPIVQQYSHAKLLGGESLRLYEKEAVWTDLYMLGFKEPKECGAEMTNSIIKSVEDETTD